MSWVQYAIVILSITLGIVVHKKIKHTAFVGNKYVRLFVIMMMCVVAVTTLYLFVL